MLIDSHAHLDDDAFDKDRDETVARARSQGITAILNAGADLYSSNRAVELATEYDIVWAAVGVHPHDAKTVREEDYPRLAELAGRPKVAAIGEIGLDYHYNHSPRDVQQAVFVRQLDMARNLGKPVIIHDREAHADILATVRREGKGLTGVFHCFSGSLEMARDVLKLGFYVSIAGPVTFPNSAKLKEIAREVPLDRLLIETDCPYLTPQPFRGRRNEPAYVRYVAETVAALRDLPIETVAEATARNARDLFGLKSP